MFKYFLVLVVGVAIGYGYGWKDAQLHPKHVVERVIERVGGETRKRMDSHLESLDATSNSR